MTSGLQKRISTKKQSKLYYNFYINVTLKNGLIKGETVDNYETSKQFATLTVDDSIASQHSLTFKSRSRYRLIMHNRSVVAEIGSNRMDRIASKDNHIRPNPMSIPRTLIPGGVKTSNQNIKQQVTPELGRSSGVLSVLLDSLVAYMALLRTLSPASDGSLYSTAVALYMAYRAG